METLKANVPQKKDVNKLTEEQICLKNESDFINKNYISKVEFDNLTDENKILVIKK